MKVKYIGEDGMVNYGGKRLMNGDVIEGKDAEAIAQKVTKGKWSNFEILEIGTKSDEPTNPGMKIIDEESDGE